MKTACFSGHRPEKLPQKGDLNSPEMRRLISLVQLEVIESINNGYLNFITGMAKGLDIIAAKIVLELKKDNKDIKLICAIPFKGHADKIKGIDKWEYGNIISEADEVVVLSERYYPNCLKDRNYYMVERSQKLIAIIANYRSGTGQTVRYAQKMNLDIKLIDINGLSKIL